VCCAAVQGVLSEEHCRQVVEQISGALSYIHSKGIVHRDIKVGWAWIGILLLLVAGHDC
jgi:serine/threonine protein kinase